MARREDPGDDGRGDNMTDDRKQNDPFLIILRKKYGIPESWQWITLDAHDQPEDFVKVSGAVPIGVIARGKRKGRPKFGKARDTFFVRMADVRAARQAMKDKHD